MTVAAHRFASRRVLVPKVAQGSSIPRIIHQTYRTAALPASLTANVEDIKRRNPGWSYLFYDDHAVGAFIEREYGAAVLRAYRGLRPGYGAARADLFRYLLMYRIGGVYLDVKSTALLPLDQIVRPDDRYLLAFWRTESGERLLDWGLHSELSAVDFDELQQWHIICAPGHPYLHAVIEAVLRNIAAYSPARHGFGKYATLRVTGPIAYSLAIRGCMQDGAHRMFNAQTCGLRYSVLPQASSHVDVLSDHYSRQIRAPLTRIGLVKFLTWQVKRIRWRLFHAVRQGLLF